MLLAQVQALAVSLGLPGDVGYSCETADYFRQEHIDPRILSFEVTMKKLNDDDVCVLEYFPFKNFFVEYLNGTNIPHVCLIVFQLSS